MRPRRIGFLFLVMLAFLQFVPSAYCDPAKRVLAYYPYWNPKTYNAANIPYHLLTHIAHAFVIPKDDGTLAVEDGFLEPELIRRAHEAGVKVLLSIGGSGTGAAFRKVLVDPDLLAKFVDQVEAFCRANGYDGVDIDDESPEDAAHRDGLTELMQDLRKKFNASPAPSPSWLLSMATPMGDWSGKWFDLKALSESVDFFNVMTYDVHGSWSQRAGHNAPLHSSGRLAEDGDLAGGMDYWLNTRGIAPDKINMGLAFYGVKFSEQKELGESCACNGKNTTQVPYAEILGMIGNSWTRAWDDEAKSPYLTHDQDQGLLVYDDPESIGIKTDFALSESKVAGVFMWDLSEDATPQGQPLLETMVRHANGLSLAVYAFADKPQAQPGDTMTWTFRYKNLDKTVLSGVSIKVTLDSNLTKVQGLPAEALAKEGGSMWKIGEVAAQAQGTVTLSATVKADASMGTILRLKPTVHYESGGQSHDLTIADPSVSLSVQPSK